MSLRPEFAKHLAQVASAARMAERPKARQFTTGQISPTIRTPQKLLPERIRAGSRDELLERSILIYIKQQPQPESRASLPPAAFIGRGSRGPLGSPDNAMRVHKTSNQYVVPFGDVKDGDVITIADEGELVEGDYGTRLVVKVILPDGLEKKMSLNPTSLNTLIDAFGTDTKPWVGKEVKVRVAQMTVRDTPRDVIFVTAPAQGLD